MTDLKPAIALLAKALAEAAPARPAPARTLSIGDAALVFDTAQPLHSTVRHTFAIGADIAVLQLPQQTLDRILQPLGVACPQDHTQQGLLLELVCLDMLTALEAQLGSPIRPVTADTPPHAFGVTIDGLPLSLHLSDGLAAALEDLLDRNAAPPDLPDPAAMTVPVTLRIGQQFLTRDEIAALEIGDVVMLEPGPALMLADETLAAAVALTQSGAVLQSGLSPLPDPAPHSDPRICAIAARSRMTLAELNDLATGSPLPVAAFADAAVDLEIGGRIMARGVPITLGSGEGIRILHLFAPDHV